MQDFQQIEWDAETAGDCRAIIHLALAEDLGEAGDITATALIAADRRASATIVARRAGVIAGLPAAELTLCVFSPESTFQSLARDGQTVAAGAPLATIHGLARDLLATERTMLNFLGRLSGIATLTSRYAAAVAGLKAKIYDTRKTTPGWRRLEKYAVRAGGGHIYRTGLWDAILIKDNHLACGPAPSGEGALPYPADEAVRRAKTFLATLPPTDGPTPLIEVEVDTLEQLAAALRAAPDLILLDNMSPATLREAVALRDQANPAISLEASGGVNLENVREIATTGVERISVGALTHSAPTLDIALDWNYS